MSWGTRGRLKKTGMDAFQAYLTWRHYILEATERTGHTNYKQAQSRSQCPVTLLHHSVFVHGDHRRAISTGMRRSIASEPGERCRGRSRPARQSGSGSPVCTCRIHGSSTPCGSFSLRPNEPLSHFQYLLMKNTVRKGIRGAEYRHDELGGGRVFHGMLSLERLLRRWWSLLSHMNADGLPVPPAVNRDGWVDANYQRKWAGRGGSRRRWN